MKPNIVDIPCQGNLFDLFQFLISDFSMENLAKNGLESDSVKVLP